MYALDLAFNKEIIAPKEMQSATKRIIARILSNSNKEVRDLQLGKDITSGYSCINCEEIPNNTIFSNCIFYKLAFKLPTKVKFIDCKFINCKFFSCTDIEFENCELDNFYFDCYSYEQSTFAGDCRFTNTKGFGSYALKNIRNCKTLLVSKDCSTNLISLEESFREKLEIIKEYEKQQKELRKNLKYGYKIVRTPVLVKLSFPEDAKTVNLNCSKSRASKAFVEDVIILNSFEGKGVTNTEYDKTEYKVGELVYPNSFNDNPYESCGNGIHFCKDLKDVIYYGGLTTEEESIFNEVFKRIKNEED